MQIRMTIGVCAVALFLGAAAPAAAATVQQVRSFDYQQAVVTHLNPYDLTEAKSQNLHFDAFDTSLGVLTGAS